MLGSRLRDTRKQHGLTQQQAADYMMISLNAYQKYEQGTRKPSPDALVKLADFYETSTDYLLGRTDNPFFEAPSGE